MRLRCRQSKMLDSDSSINTAIMLSDRDMETSPRHPHVFVSLRPTIRATRTSANPWDNRSVSSAPYAQARDKSKPAATSSARVTRTLTTSSIAPECAALWPEVTPKRDRHLSIPAIANTSARMLRTIASSIVGPRPCDHGDVTVRTDAFKAAALHQWRAGTSTMLEAFERNVIAIRCWLSCGSSEWCRNALELALSVGGASSP